MSVTASLREIAGLLRARRTFLVTTHLGPDADAIGSALALRRLLLALDKEVEVAHAESVPGFLHFLPQWSVVKKAPERTDYDAIVVVDCGDRKRVAVPARVLNAASLLIDIDHHDPERAFGHYQCVDPRASATAEIIFELARELEVVVDADTASLLYAAIASDTGGFRFTNTSARALTVCARLIEAGAQPEPIMKELFHQRSWATLRLLATALRNSVSEHDGRLVWTTLRRADYEAAAAVDADTEGLIDLLRSARGCAVCVLFRVTERGRSKASLRCEPPHTVDSLAVEFGGGGHPYASGFSTDRSLEVVVESTLQKLRRLVND